MWPFFFLVLNLPPSIRHRFANFIFMSIATSVTLGEPKNFNTHTDPIVDDLIQGWQRGFLVETPTGPKVIKVMMALMCADTPGEKFSLVPCIALNNFARACGDFEPSRTYGRRWMYILRSTGRVVSPLFEFCPCL
jgi:hypothetical protein